MPGFPTRGNEMDLLLANWARAVASSSASSSEPANNGGTTVGCVCNLPTSPDRCIASAFLPSARKESLGLGLSSKVNAGGSPTAFLQITYVYCIVSGVPPPRFALLVCRMLRGVGHWGREQEQEQDHRNSRTEKPTCDDFSLLEKVREMRLRLSTSLKHGRGRERVRWIRAPPGLSLDLLAQLGGNPIVASMVFRLVHNLIRNRGFLSWVSMPINFWGTQR